MSGCSRHILSQHIQSGLRDIADIDASCIWYHWYDATTRPTSPAHRGAVYMSRGCMLELAAALCDPQLRAAEQRLGASALTASVSWVAERERQRAVYYIYYIYISYIYIYHIYIYIIYIYMIYIYISYTYIYVYHIYISYIYIYICHIYILYYIYITYIRYILYNIILRPDALCCPEIYRDVPGMLVMVMMMMMMMMMMMKIFNECRSLTRVGELNPYRWM